MGRETGEALRLAAFFLCVGSRPGHDLGSTPMLWSKASRDIETQDGNHSSGHHCQVEPGLLASLP
ncbi:hypothetical protein CEE69_04245 [Rhodopirellula bahusiensis]|uniref:Uncharacterized protein n=1 Tax=Rhodopirellula bahusiensis TaxID=2014065 RepID=A0A2G1WC24_9BACT|nr:hypothetical protein CEE69_04245 [Rhodopirellula bahusiensis]